jgi:hypothetical protein
VFAAQHIFLFLFFLLSFLSFSLLRAPRTHLAFYLSTSRDAAVREVHRKLLIPGLSVAWLGALGDDNGALKVHEPGIGQQGQAVAHHVSLHSQIHVVERSVQGLVVRNICLFRASRLWKNDLHAVHSDSHANDRVHLHLWHGVSGRWQVRGE